MTYQTLLYQVENRILTITLNRPEQMNAFTVEMANELEHAFKTASEDDNIGVIVVTGAGKAFCANTALCLLDPVTSMAKIIALESG